MIVKGLKEKVKRSIIEKLCSKTKSYYIIPVNFSGTFSSRFEVEKFISTLILFSSALSSRAVLWEKK